MMKVLLLSCSTGEGHNHCARAVRQQLDRMGVETDFFDMLHLFGEPGPIGVEQLLNVISTKAPNLFGWMYRTGEKVSALGVTSPVYLMNTNYGRKLCDLINENGYDAVVCSHLFPMETLTFIRKHWPLKAFCCGILSDYTCIPFLAETELDGYFLPHELVRRECEAAGIPADKLIVTGMPVDAAFRAPMSKAEARGLLGIPALAKVYLIMTGGIGCGDAIGLCDALLELPDEDALILVLAGRNEELLNGLNEKYGAETEVRALPFTDRVSAYMRAADVLLSKAGGISSAEAAVANVPLVHTMMIPGVETQNAAFFQSLGMSLVADSNEAAARFADRIVYDGKTGARLMAAQRAEMPGDGAERIAAYIAAQKETEGARQL
jgi:processive 1,2-diacylglycerol beta-glucosyltransferase